MAVEQDDLSFQSVLNKMVRKRWPTYNVWVDCYTIFNKDYSKNTAVYVRMIPPLARGQKSKPPIEYKTKFDWRNEKLQCAQRVMTALILLEDGHGQEVEQG